MQVTLEFVLVNEDAADAAPIPGFNVNEVGALAAIPLPGDCVCMFENGPIYEVLDRTFNWHSPTQVRVEVFVELLDDDGDDEGLDD